MVDRSRQAVSRAETDQGAARQRAARVPARLEAAYEDPERQVFLPTLDLSESGVFLLSEDAPLVGSQAQVVFELPGEEVFLRLRGRVARVQTEPVPGFALRFDPVRQDAGSLTSLRDFVGRHAAP